MTIVEEVRDCANRLDQLFRQPHSMKDVEAELRHFARALDLSQFKPKAPQDVRDVLESLHKYQRALETGDPDRQPTEGSDIALVKRVYNLIESLSAQPAAAQKRNAALEQDARRYQTCLKLGFPVRNQSPARDGLRWTINGEFFGSTPQEAIDAAIGKGEK